ncbi:MAG TPA: chemotaxis protein CheW, partial [Vicinamibacteria bacterium]|nr:chemotaxis protein CheW [Vicinamibacteria bacterium]
MSDPGDTPFLTFVLADEQYGISVLRVREIIEYGAVTRVPRTPPWIRGVINLRGGVVPVVDLAVKLGLPPCEVTARTCVVIIEPRGEGERLLMGVVADAVSQVLELRAQDIEPAPPFGTRIHLDYLVGMARSDQKFVLLLDIDR